MASTILPGFTASSAAPTSASSGALPSARVASFQTSLAAAAPSQGAPLSPTQVALANSGKKQTAVQVSVQKRQQAIQAQNARNSLYATALQKRKAGASAGGPTGGGYSGSLADVDLGNVSGSASRSKALQYASSLVGKTPYVWGGNSVKGTDCAGLVMMTYKQLGINIDTDRQISHIPGVRTSVSNLRPGDLVAWKDGSHIAIYAGNGKIIEAAHPGTNVRVHNIWSNAVYGIALRLPGE